ncbi:MAG: Uma2 family endonuclease [Lachnospiraceae bacterium]|nr:Uma2 family endonuclease [Lachnospiraceae bacterium]
MLPNGERAELIDGKIYNMAPPSRIHQELVSELHRVISNYIHNHKGDCKIYPSPFAVFLNNDETTYIEPDISVIYDKNKLTDKGCNGAPDFIIEIVSPSSRRIDYNIKNGKYAEAGVREYWIVDPQKERTTIYRYEEDEAPIIFTFEQTITVGIYKDLSINISELL